MSDEPDQSTRFQFGNNAWRARSSHGRNPIFANPEELQDAVEQYFEWVEDNPLMGVDTVKFQGSGTIMPVPKMRAMTIRGLCNFLDIAEVTWRDYRSKSDFSSTCERAESFIYQQKVEGAAADLLNAGFIGKEIGLVDKAAVEHTGELEFAGDILFKKKNG